MKWILKWLRNRQSEWYVFIFERDEVAPSVLENMDEAYDDGFDDSVAYIPKDERKLSVRVWLKKNTPYETARLNTLKEINND